MDYVVSLVGVAGFLLAGRHIWWAWYVNLGCQVLWFVYAVSLREWGLLLGVAFYTVAFTANAAKWTREHRERVADDAR